MQGPLVTQLLLSKGFARYTQVRITLYPLDFPPLTQLCQVHTLPTLATILAPFGGDKFDGWADFVAPRFEAFVGLFADPFYLEKIKPVEEYMLDVSATLVINAGFEEVFIADGKATELAK